MGKNYKQLSLEERCKISSLRGDGVSIRQIAAIMDHTASTIIREINRNSGSQDYKLSYADKKAWARRWKGSRLEHQPSLQKYVFDRLTMGWSLQQISGRLKLGNSSTLTSQESIYRFIYTQYARTKDSAWRKLLPRGKYKRGYRYRKWYNYVDSIRNRVTIMDRPKHKNNRKQFGHWEADLLMFSDKNNNVLVTLERKSRFVMLSLQYSKKAEKGIENKINMLGKLPTKLR